MAEKTTPFPDGGAIDMVPVPMFEFSLTVPNQDGRVITMKMGYSAEVVRDLIPQMEEWLEGVGDATNTTA